MSFVSNRYLDKNDISDISMNIKQEVNHFVVVAEGQTYSLVFCYGSCKEVSNEVTLNLVR